MKNVRNMFKTAAMLLACIALLSTEAFPAGVPQKLPTDVIQFGKSGSASDKQLIFDFGLGGSNPFLSGSSSLLKYSKNGFSLGDGTNSTKNIFANIGGSNPFIQYNASNGDWEFSNDGVNATPVGSGSGASGIQLLTNPGFESGVTLDWSNTGGTFAASSSNPLVGRQSALFTASAGSQSFQSGLHAVPLGLQGQACVGSIMYTGGDSGLTFKVVDNSSNVLASHVLTAATTATTVNLPFLCPISGSVRLQVSSSASAAQIKADNAFLGQNTLIALSQASYVGGVVLPNNCLMNNSATGSYADLVPSGCGGYTLKGSATAFDDTVNGSITFANLPPGEYLGRWSGSCARGNASSNTIHYAATDGTTYSPEAQLASGAAQTLFAGCTFDVHVTYTTAGSHSFKVQGWGSASDSIDFYNQGGQPAEMFSLYRYPSSDQIAVRADTSALNWTGYTTVSPGGCSTTSTSYADVAACTGIALSTQTNRNFGTVVTEASGLPGVTFTPTRIGNYAVCASGQISGSSAQVTSVRLVDGASNVISNGMSVAPNPTTSLSSYSLCGTEQVSSLGSPLTVKLQMAVTGSTSAFITGNAAGTPMVNWSIMAIDQQIPAPVLVGSVVSKSSGVEAVNRLRFAGDSLATTACTSDPCIIVTQSGDWVSAVNRTGTGTYVVHISAGAFSAAPVCSITSTNQVTGGSDSIAQGNGAPTASTVSIINLTHNTSAAAADEVIDVLCMGPK